MSESEPTEAEKTQGYKTCECGHGVHLLQAGFEIETYSCDQCGEHVADKDEFVRLNSGVEILSK